jgi:hypothetical protein
MESHTLRLHLGAALKEPEVRRACHAVERVMGVGDVLDNLSPATLEMIRDYCSEYIKGRKDSMSDLKRGFIHLVVDYLNDARLHERRLYHGITGGDDEPKKTA